LGRELVRWIPAQIGRVIGMLGIIVLPAVVAGAVGERSHGRSGLLAVCRSRRAGGRTSVRTASRESCTTLGRRRGDTSGDSGGSADGERNPVHTLRRSAGSTH
jgi:hypothetical protein